jgi:NADH:ubiquinone oxidoreductase subunit E
MDVAAGKADIPYRQEVPMDDQVVEEIVAQHHGSLGGMLSILSEVQAKYGYLPQDALRRIAAAAGNSLTDIYAVVTCYRAFSLKPRGKHLVSACLGTACHVRGAPKIAEELSRLTIDLSPDAHLLGLNSSGHRLSLPLPSRWRPTAPSTPCRAT